MSNDAVFNLPGMGKIKLVVWDLDETFWRGILTEGGIVYQQAHHDLVIELARRGVVSAICSNNDEAPVRAYLEERGLWDYFVFPQVSWARKGGMVRRLIDNAQLRSANVLFIDDKPSNLDEVAQACPGIMTALPDRIDALIARVGELPVSDPAMTRLQQYKILEQKAAARQQVLDLGASGDDFLRQSAIRVRFLTGAQAPVDRIVEMIERTNQLNFTRMQPPRAAIVDMLRHADWEAGCIEVADRYGDYGIVGFYAVQKAGGRRLLRHYLFSCRILNMDVEAWLYHHLGRPELGDIATNGFERPRAIDWITVERAPSGASGAGTACKRKPSLAARASYQLFLLTQRLPALRYCSLWTSAMAARLLPYRPVASAPMLLRGGCDTWAIADFLRADGVASVREVGEWRQTLEALRYPESLGHVSLARLSQALLWSGDLTLAHGTSTRDLFAGHDMAVLSLARDYKAGLYRYRDTDVLLPIAPFDVDLTDPAVWPEVTSWRTRHGPASGPWLAPCYSLAGLRWLKENCTPLSAAERRQRILDNIAWCAERAAIGVRLVFVTAAELAPDDIYPMWRGIPDEVSLLNKHVAALVAKLDNATLLPVQEVVRDKALLADRHPYHYVRSVHQTLARLLQNIGDDTRDAVPHMLHRAT
ncbi:hypothetical protein E7V67_021965 [[Empedobacter] haloabium]|uniref:HAD-IIIC family phosphatase n=1 Tax=[Empedobacter] haloabium TaxID=592317 RepID=A0ABZ1UJP5_9BURK